MPPSNNQSISLSVGHIFASIQEGRDAVLSAAVEEGLGFSPTFSDRKRFIAVCYAKAETACPFYIRIAYQERSEEVELRKLVPHSCNAIDHQGWKRANSLKFIASRHSDLVKSEPRTKPRQIQTIERLNHSNQLTYHQAWRAKKEIHTSAYLEKKHSYQLIYPFLEAITDAGLNSEDEDADGNWATSRADAAISRDGDYRFEWCQVAPRACIHAFRHNRRLICLDGAHMKIERELVLLIVTTLDANENTLPLMWGFAKNETIESWTQFLSYFREFFLDSIPEEEKRASFEYLTVISDRGKGLAPAVTSILPKAFHYHCTQHLAANVGNAFGKNVEKLFRAACLVDSSASFRTRLDQIEATSASARHYVDQLESTRYAASAAPLVDFPRYGQTCSNIAESMNSAWMEARELPLLHSLHYLWVYAMRKFYERRHDTQKHGKFTNYCMAYYMGELKDSFQFLVTPQERENQIAMVYRTNPSDPDTRIVSLGAKKCSCLAFQDHKIPCRHAIAAARFFGVDSTSLIADFYQLSEYREQYKFSPSTILLAELEPDGVTLPPQDLFPLRGRPIKKRFKRKTRETEARRLGKMRSPEAQRQRQEEAAARYQSGASRFQAQPSISIARRVDRHPLARRDEPIPFARPPDIGQNSDIMERIRQLQARLQDAEGEIAQQRRNVLNQPSRQSGEQERVNVESQPRPEQAEAERSDTPPRLATADSQRPTGGTASQAASPSQITYNINGPVNGFFSVTASASLSQFTINSTPPQSPPQKRAREEDEQEDGIVDEIEVAVPSTRKSARPRKKSRKAQD